MERGVAKKKKKFIIYTGTIFLAVGQLKCSFHQVNNSNIIRYFNINNEYLKMSRKQQIPRRNV